MSGNSRWTQVEAWQVRLVASMVAVRHRVRRPPAVVVVAVRQTFVGVARRSPTVSLLQEVAVALVLVSRTVIPMRSVVTVLATATVSTVRTLRQGLRVEVERHPARAGPLAALEGLGLESQQQAHLVSVVPRASITAVAVGVACTVVAVAQVTSGLAAAAVARAVSHLEPLSVPQPELAPDTDRPSSAGRCNVRRWRTSV
jgi:hypothetical protein